MAYTDYGQLKGRSYVHDWKHDEQMDYQRTHDTINGLMQQHLLAKQKKAEDEAKIKQFMGEVTLADGLNPAMDKAYREFSTPIINELGQTLVSNKDMGTDPMAQFQFKLKAQTLLKNPIVEANNNFKAQTALMQKHIDANPGFKGLYDDKIKEAEQLLNYGTIEQQRNFTFTPNAMEFADKFLDEAAKNIKLKPSDDSGVSYDKVSGGYKVLNKNEVDPESLLSAAHKLVLDHGDVATAIVSNYHKQFESDKPKEEWLNDDEILASLMKNKKDLSQTLSLHFKPENEWSRQAAKEKYKTTPWEDGILKPLKNGKEKGRFGSPLSFFGQYTRGSSFKIPYGATIYYENENGTLSSQKVDNNNFNAEYDGKMIASMTGQAIDDKSGMIKDIDTDKYITPAQALEKMGSEWKLINGQVCVKIPAKYNVTGKVPGGTAATKNKLYSNSVAVNRNIYIPIDIKDNSAIGSYNMKEAKKWMPADTSAEGEVEINTSTGGGGTNSDPLKLNP